MPGTTIAEKLLARAARADLRAGDIAVCEPEEAMCTDGPIPMALDHLQQMQPAGLRHRNGFARPGFMLAMRDAGGLVPFLRRHGKPA